MIDIVVNTTTRETRIAVLEDRVTAELYIERHRDHGLVGNIYRGRVMKVLPGMQAAFIDIGLKKAGFLYVSDVFIPGFAETAALAASPTPTTPSPTLAIEDMLVEGQELLVQVAKEPLGTKGCRLTAALSLAGRYLVLRPDSQHIGISRRITDEAERVRLQETVAAMLPPGMGCIIRTASIGVSKEAFNTDLHFLLVLWQHVQEMAGAMTGSALVYQEYDLVLRLIRDLFTHDVEHFVIDDPHTYERALAFVRTASLSPLATRLVLYQEPMPIFEAYGVERDLDHAMQRKVWLKSGGYLTIDITEALVAIDVNTGRFVGSHNQALTILTTNLEAVCEVGRQLRLRNLGGLIIIDLIDMEVEEHKAQVFATLEEVLKADRAHTKVLQISEFGLVEMTRKRVRASLNQVLCEPCRACHGTGLVESITTVCSKVFRHIQHVMQTTPDVQRLLINVSPAVASALQGEEHVYVEHAERSFGVTLLVNSDSEILHGQFEIVAC